MKADAGREEEKGNKGGREGKKAVIEEEEEEREGRGEGEEEKEGKKRKKRMKRGREKNFRTALLDQAKPSLGPETSGNA
ncbi:Cylicin-2, partial [Ophiophagus hannah]